MPARTSARLARAAPEFKGLADDYEECAAAGDGALSKQARQRFVCREQTKEAYAAGPCAAGHLQHASVPFGLLRLPSRSRLSQCMIEAVLVHKVQTDTGRTVLPKSVAASEQDQRWKAFVSARRCDSKSRGSIYDSVAGARPGTSRRPPCAIKQLGHAGGPTQH